MDFKKLGEEVFQIEIDSLKEVSKKLSSDFTSVIEAIDKSNGRCVITGMGKSGLVGQKIAATLASTGTKSFLCILGKLTMGILE